MFFKGIRALMQNLFVLLTVIILRFKCYAFRIYRKPPVIQLSMSSIPPTQIKSTEIGFNHCVYIRHTITHVLSIQCGSESPYIPILYVKMWLGIPTNFFISGEGNKTRRKLWFSANPLLLKQNWGALDLRTRAARHAQIHLCVLAEIQLH